jgi:serine/threonine protein kinase
MHSRQGYARLCKAFFRPNVSSDDPDSDLWIEMEFLPGGTLCEFLSSQLKSRKYPPLIPTEIMIILYGVANVLEKLHEQEVIHRDVKSLNIFIGGNGEPRLGNFGFARN